MVKQIDRPTFDKAYDEAILGASFVETPEYYIHSRQRYWLAVKNFMRLDLPDRPRILEIGGGQFGVLLSRLFDCEVVIGDVVDTARDDLAALGLDLIRVNLMRDPITEEDLAAFDCITILEVIEHLPQPPYLVFRRMMTLLKPGGRILFTTPNGHRFRNLIYMALGKEILDTYRYPEGDQPLGHQHEYTLKQMRTQALMAPMEIEFLEYCEGGWQGSTVKSRMARKLIAPASLIPHFKEALVASFVKPA